MSFKIEHGKSWKDHIEVDKEVAAKQDIFASLGHRPTQTLLAKNNEGDIIGFCDLAKTSEGTELRVAVVPEYQGQGIGTRLIQTGMNLAKRSGETRLYAQTLPGSISERIFLNNGFEHNQSVEQESTNLGDPKSFLERIFRR